MGSFISKIANDIRKSVREAEEEAGRNGGVEEDSYDTYLRIKGIPPIPTGKKAEERQKRVDKELEDFKRLKSRFRR